MEKLQHKEFLGLAEEAAREAGEIFKKTKGEIIKSEDKDIKITTDKVAHAFLVNFLQTKSNIPVLSEEDEEHIWDNKLKWVIDPLDGSLNFLREIPISAISISLENEEGPILGIVYDFNRGELFSGIVGEGASINGKKISVSETKNKREAIIMTGFPSHTDYSKESLDKYISFVQEYKKVRLLGSAALSLAYVACGRADAYYEKGINIWDVSAGLALVKASGGDFQKKQISENGQYEVHATNGQLD